MQIESSDIKIIRRCLEGNQLAYKQLYERYVSYCYGICLRYSVSQRDVKDVVQIIFSQLFQSLKNYDSKKSKFKTWFTHICINQILSYKRKDMKKIQIKYSEYIAQIESLYSENNIEQQIDKKHILAMIKKMPSNYQIVFNMFIIDGYSHAEISKKLNISTASSRVILNRARGWVKKTLVNHLRA